MRRLPFFLFLLIAIHSYAQEKYGCQLLQIAIETEVFKKEFLFSSKIKNEIFIIDTNKIIYDCNLNNAFEKKFIIKRSFPVYNKKFQQYDEEYLSSIIFYKFKKEGRVFRFSFLCLTTNRFINFQIKRKLSGKFKIIQFDSGVF